MDTVRTYVHTYTPSTQRTQRCCIPWSVGGGNFAVSMDGCLRCAMGVREVWFPVNKLRQTRSRPGWAGVLLGTATGAFPRFGDGPTAQLHCTVLCGAVRCCTSEGCALPYLERLRSGRRRRVLVVDDTARHACGC